MEKLIKILSIDGGGIRGIIPAIVLAEIEKKTRKPISQLFHIMTGTSTGGILSLALSRPGEGTREPVFTAEDLIFLYQKNGNEIFSRSFMHRIASINGVVSEKYPEDGIEKVLDEYFGKTKISSALTDITVTSYDIERRVPFLFKRQLARSQKKHDFFMKDIARATSAAPTFFKPARIDTKDSMDYLPLIDGGVFANNPSLVALTEARSVYQHTHDFLLLSLGTGSVTRPYLYRKAKNWGLIGWARPILDVVFDGISDAIDQQIRVLLNPTRHSPKMYYRIQTKLDKNRGSMDDVTPDNIKILKLIGESIVKERQYEIDEICEKLTS
jgi:uncharacterized protein